MRVKKVTWRMRNDYSALLACPHCAHEQDQCGLYADIYFATEVLPKLFYCDKCGLNDLGEKRAVPEVAA